MTNAQASDLEFIRDMAEAGQNAPLLGGRFLAWFGGLASLAYFAHYMIAEGMFGLTGIAFAYLWIGFAVIAGIGYALMVMSFPKAKPGAASAGNAASMLVWKAGGFAMSAFFVALIIKSFMAGEASQGFIWSAPFVLSIYGVGQLTSGWMAKSKPLTLAGYIALVGAAVAVLFIDSNTIWLVGGVVAALAVFVPGVMLMKGEPSETV